MPAAPRTPAPRAWIGAVAAMFACGWGGNQFTPLLLMYRQQAGYSAVTVDAFLAAYVLGLVPGLLLGGPLSDRLGRKPLMLAGSAASLVASGVLAAGVFGQVPIYAGRMLTGIALGIAMAVGTSWVKELSQAPYDPSAEPGTGARRASLGLTLGLGLGAGVAGALAQWGPWPMVLPYGVHMLVALAGLVALAKVPETRARPAAPNGFLADLKVPSAGHRRFLRVVLPMAPWVFGSTGIAYAVMPQIVEKQVGDWGLAYATLLTVLTLGTGALIQPFAKRLGARSTARAIVLAMLLMALGMAVCAVDAVLLSPWLALAAAVLLGAAYGIALVSGLLEIQRIAGPDDLAGLTGVYYALTYTGFMAPPVLAALSAVVPYVAMFAFLTLLALGCLAVIAGSTRVPAAPAGTPAPPVAEGGPRHGAEESTGEAAEEHSEQGAVR
ncbi:MFS transporter [Streptomyces sp. ODS28]|uniref:MFS transporter n=1 Tax=Streptomyces sp. ODS28 TaxID=3136688 RepID=UPI0031E6573A